MLRTDPDYFPGVTHPATYNFPDFEEPETCMSADELFDARTANDSEVSPQEWQDASDRRCNPGKVAAQVSNRNASLSSMKMATVVKASVPMAYLNTPN